VTEPTHSTLPDLPGGPYDLEFFFDPGCPFAWQTSVWIRRVQALRPVAVGWRFISLKFINEDNDVPPAFTDSQHRGLRYHRICAAARAAHGNDAVGDLYRGWGERYWYTTPASDDLGQRMVDAASAVDLEELLSAVGLPAALLDAADDESWDGTIRAESDEALRRTGKDVGTPILTFSPPDGNSLFGPVISSVPDDETSLAFYDALRVIADFPAFSELKRSTRSALDLPLFAEGRA
jgi:2-hydroxychromene-2-carboxylate isomerase